MKSTPKSAGTGSVCMRAHPSTQKKKPRLVAKVAQPVNRDFGNPYTGCGGIKGDHLCSGAGSCTDTYRFEGVFGKDRVVDEDGARVIEINGQTLGIAKAAGQANTVTIQHFELAQALGSQGYLGLKLALTDAGDGNPFAQSSDATSGAISAQANEGGAQAFTLRLSVPAAAKNTSKTIAVNQLNKSGESVFCFKNEAANDGWMRRAA